MPGSERGVARPVRAAIVGCGDVSVVHAESLAAMQAEGLVELAAICDSDPERAQSAQAMYGVPSYTDHRALLESGNIDVVHVTTPHHQHTEASLDALAAGVDVITEKPLAHSRAEARRFVDEAGRLTQSPQNGGSRPPRIGVCLQNRYNVSSMRMRQLLDSGELGSILGAYASVVWTRSEAYYRAKPWRGRWDKAGGGLLINQALHTLDLTQWLMGPVTNTTGNATSRVYGHVSQVEDTCEAVFEHGPDLRTTFYGTLTAPRHRSVELEITGENGTACIGTAGFSVTFGDGTVLTVPERVAASPGRSYWGVSHELLIRDFYGTREDTDPFWITPSEAAKCLDMVFDIYDQSAFEERESA